MSNTSSLDRGSGNNLLSEKFPGYFPVFSRTSIVQSGKPKLFLLNRCAGNLDASVLKVVTEIREKFDAEEKKNEKKKATDLRKTVDVEVELLSFSFLGVNFFFLTH